MIYYLNENSLLHKNDAIQNKYDSKEKNWLRDISSNNIEDL